MTKIYSKKTKALLLFMLLPFFSFAQQINLLQNTSNAITEQAEILISRLPPFNGEPAHEGTSAGNYARLYNLSALGYTKFEVTKVNFAVQGFQKGTATNFPVTVKVYASTGGVADANLTLKGQETVNITAAMVGTVVQVTLPTVASVTSPEMFIVVSAPSGLDTDTKFFLGANTDGETAAGYIKINNQTVFKTLAELNRPVNHFVLFPTGNATTQCPTGDVNLTTQAQVNQFLVDYPNCTEIKGNLAIGVNPGVSDITNLTPLNKLTSIGGYLVIENNALTNINALSNLKTIGADLTIAGNSSLTNVNGLGGVTSIGGWLTVQNNQALTCISGLQNITSGIVNLNIINNSALAACDISNFCTYLANPAATHPRTISGNLANCLNTAAVVAACNPLPQCPPGNVNLTTQAQIDQFIIDYPNCTQINGHLEIGIWDGASNITNLNGLANITTITGSAGISFNPNLNNVNGLSNLTSVGGILQIVQNAALTNVNGLSSLTAIGGNLIIAENAILNNISGLSNIAATSIIATNGFGLMIQNNPALAVCNLPNLCTYIANPAATHPRTISGNLDNCLNEAAVVAACSASACPTGNVVLTTQAQVNQFIINYPNCTQISGNLDINNASGITNLNGLANITKVTGFVRIAGNANLTDISALNNLTSVEGGYFVITYNPQLTNLTGLSGLKSVTGNMGITNNVKITNVDALSSLETVGSLEFIANAKLTNLNGLSGLTSTNAGVKIQNNAELANLNGLSNLTSIRGTLEIGGNAKLADISGVGNISGINRLIIGHNPLLAVCNLPNLCAYLANPTNTHPRNITGNLANCLDEAAVVAACNPPTCPTGDVVLNTQAEVNAFAANYPNCTEIDGNLFIGVSTGTSDITDLSPLNKIETVTGDFNIERTALTGINGLNNLASVGGDAYIGLNPSLAQINNLNSLTNVVGSLNISDNPLLTSVNGPNNLANVGGFLKMWDNAALNNIDGLSNLESIGGTLTIANNAALPNLNGLSNLTSMQGSLFIQSNALLATISGLQNITSGIVDLTIKNNPALAVCNLPNLCAYLAGAGVREISGNLANCLDEAAVIAACFSVLPVNLASFTAKADGNYALLQWKTAQESNNKGFEIWRAESKKTKDQSEENTTFIKIGDVSASHISKIYSFTDKSPLNGTNYYKLVQVDNDGKTTELGIRTVNFGLPTSNIQLFPNPTTINEVTVNWGSSSVNSLKIIDLNGKILQTIQPKPASTSIIISLANYPAGTYLVRIEGNNGVETKKVTKL